MKEISVEEVKMLLNCVNNDPEEIILVDGEIYELYTDNDEYGLWRDNESVYLPIDSEKNRRFYLKDGAIIVKGDCTWTDSCCFGDNDGFWSKDNIKISRFTKAEFFIP